MNVLITS